MRRRERIEKKSQHAKTRESQEQAPVSKEHKSSFYYKHYKKLMILPFLILFIALVAIGAKYAQTGEFMNMGISIKGGISITILDPTIETSELEASMKQSFPDNQINTRTIESAGSRSGTIVESDVTPEDTQGTQRFIAEIRRLTNATDAQLSVETIGSSLGAAFFRQALTAMLLAFVFMAIVVFLHFRVFVPSIAIVLAAFSNIVITVAVANIIGLKIGTAGIAALLMLIGYSVDTDILLSSRVIRGKEGTVYERIVGSIKTGTIMNLTTFVASAVAFFISDSEVIKEIVLILIIGLVADMLNTWIQNAGILRYYYEKKGVE